MSTHTHNSETIVFRWRWAALSTNQLTQSNRAKAVVVRTLVECVYIFSLWSKSVKCDNWFRLNCCDWESLLAYASYLLMNRNYSVSVGQIFHDNCNDLYSVQFIQIDFSSSIELKTCESWVKWQFTKRKKSLIDHHLTKRIQCMVCWRAKRSLRLRIRAIARLFPF